MTPKKRLQVLLAGGGRCAACRAKITGPFVCDHILPLELGGLDELGNLQPLCEACDKAKTKGDRKRIDKMRRQSKMADPKAPSKLRSRGFDKTLRKCFDGRVEKRWPG